MTETTTQPVAVETATTEPVPEAPTAEMPAPTAPEAAPQVAHTPGGLPVLPLALTGANTMAGLLSAAALAGGPVAAAVAATGVSAVGVAAAQRLKTTSSRAGRSHASRQNATGAAGGGRRGSRVPTQHHSSSPSPSKTGTGRKRGTGPTRTRSSGSASAPRATGSTRHRSTMSAAPLKGGTSRGPGGTLAARGPQPGPLTAPRRTGTDRPTNRMRQVRELRAQQHNAAPTRVQQRAQTTAARRQLADTRRAATADRRLTKSAGQHRAGGALHRARAGLGGWRDAAVGKVRSARDRRTEAALDRHRRSAEARRLVALKAPARRAARAALWRSAARMHARRLLAALVAAPVGLLGMLTTPLGRKLGWAWLQYPGRRLYRRLAAAARGRRNGRDAAIRDRLKAAEAAIDAEDSTTPDVVGDRAERPAGRVPNNGPASTAYEGVHVSGFRFEEAAAEMEAAAQNYEPEGCMEILAMVESLPAALTSIANVMKILAERADAEFPLEKEIAASFSDIYTSLMVSVGTAEEMGPLFRMVHAQDIARHETPRNGHEAEKGWNV
ncbi:hypothetical protein AB0E74_06810 [Streptomyces sp. NPDC030392]|uniref:hypothetical protein n=1 Tax=Streptomyces sp. NPDC030392 TaxID=3155468 RepID=UPI0033C391CD